MIELDVDGVKRVVPDPSRPPFSQIAELMRVSAEARRKSMEYHLAGLFEVSTDLFDISFDLELLASTMKISKGLA